MGIHPVSISLEPGAKLVPYHECMRDFYEHLVKYLGNETELIQAEGACNEAAAIWLELNTADVPGKVPTPLG